MIQPSHGVSVFVATKPVDFRKGDDGLAALIQSHLQKKPFDGASYVFRAKRVDRLKMIRWDGTGLVMAYKRLEQNTYKWPAIALTNSDALVGNIFSASAPGREAIPTAIPFGR